MTLGRIRTLGAGTFLLAISVMVPATAIAADPVVPSAGAWVAINNNNTWLTGNDTPPGVNPWPSAAISEFQFQLVKVGNGPTESLTSVTLQRPRGQYDHSFGFPMGQRLGSVRITLRKPAAGGKDDWFLANLIDPKVTADEVRTSNGATSGTEVLILSFTKAQVFHRVQTTQGYGEYAEVPPQFDIKDIVALAPTPTLPGRVATPINPVSAQQH